MDKQLFAQPFANLTDYSHWVVAFSGGLDSTVLLHAAAQFLSDCDQLGREHTVSKFKHSKPRLLAVHVDHQLSNEHHEWALHCQAQCESLEIPFELITVDVDANVASLEQAARTARFAALQKLTAQLEGRVAILLAHHRNDQAETLLLRLLRGTGVFGAAGMLRERRISKADIIRPLLILDKSELLEYATEYALSWVEDESNSNDKFDRNFLRQQIFPELASRWPTVNQNLFRFSRLAFDSQKLNDELAQLDLQSLRDSNSRYGFSVSQNKLCQLAAHRRKNLYRYLALRLSNAYPDYSKVDSLDQWILDDSLEGQVDLDGCRFYKYRAQIFILTEEWLNSILHTDLNRPLLWQNKPTTEADIVVLTSGKLQVCEHSRGLQPGEYQIRKRERNATLCVNGVNKSVHKLMQEMGVPSWLRDAYPVLYSGQTLAAVPPIVGDQFTCSASPGANWCFVYPFPNED